MPNGTEGFWRGLGYAGQMEQQKRADYINRMNQQMGQRVQGWNEQMAQQQAAQAEQTQIRTAYLKMTQQQYNPMTNQPYELPSLDVVNERMTYAFGPDWPSRMGGQAPPATATEDDDEGAPPGTGAPTAGQDPYWQAVRGAAKGVVRRGMEAIQDPRVISALTRSIPFVGAARDYYKARQDTERPGFWERGVEAFRDPMVQRTLIRSMPVIGTTGEWLYNRYGPQQGTPQPEEQPVTPTPTPEAALPVQQGVPTAAAGVYPPTPRTAPRVYSAYRGKRNPYQNERRAGSFWT